MSSQHLGYHKKSLICLKTSIHVVQTRTYMHVYIHVPKIYGRWQFDFELNISFPVVIEEQQM